jgi:hypothetical protein
VEKKEPIEKVIFLTALDVTIALAFLEGEDIQSGKLDSALGL